MSVLCNNIASTYNIIPGQSWGSAPQDAQTLYAKYTDTKGNNCDNYVTHDYKKTVSPGTVNLTNQCSEPIKYIDQNNPNWLDINNNISIAAGETKNVSMGSKYIFYVGTPAKSCNYLASPDLSSITLSLIGSTYCKNIQAQMISKQNITVSCSQ